MCNNNNRSVPVLKLHSNKLVAQHRNDSYLNVYISIGEIFLPQFTPAFINEERNQSVNGPLK